MPYLNVTTDYLQNLKCPNPGCQRGYALKEFLDIVNQSGLIYTEVDNETYQGITCPNCLTPSLLRFNQNSTLVDLRDFILAPDLNQAVNTMESFIPGLGKDLNIEPLQFKRVPAYDDLTVDHENLRLACATLLVDYYRSDPSIQVQLSPGGSPNLFEGLEHVQNKIHFSDEQFDPESHEPWFEDLPNVGMGHYRGYFKKNYNGFKLSDEQFRLRFDEEYQTKTVRLRRLYPASKWFKCLLTIINPKRITEIRNGVPYGENFSKKELYDRKWAWRFLLEESSEEYLGECVTRHLDSFGYVDLSKLKSRDRIDKHVKENLGVLNFGPTEKLRGYWKRLGAEQEIKNYFKQLHQKIIFKVSSDYALHEDRDLLASWVDTLNDLKENRKALFVKAPMGIGKTTAIVDGLVSNPDISAVIFMPSNKLCAELTFRLKRKIAKQKGYDERTISNNIEFVQDADGKNILDGNGLPVTSFRPEFLQHEVYFVDGISKPDCLKYDDIILRYRKEWRFKGDFCQECRKNKEIGCRFFDHPLKAPSARIVITTHYQYDRFYQDSKLQKWYRGGIGNQTFTAPRDVFIVDEDLVLSQCYQPQGLKLYKFRRFITTFKENIKKMLPQEEIKSIQKKLERLLGKITECEISSIIPPLDPGFAFPEKIVQHWKSSFLKQKIYIPGILNAEGLIGNYLTMLEAAINTGVVVEKYSIYDSERTPIKSVKNLFIPNTKKYDLSGMPPHVFFDGTKTDVKFLKAKLLNVEFEDLHINVKVPSRLRVWQNMNTNLAKTGIEKESPKVECFIRDLIQEKGTARKYFFLSTRSTRDEYLDQLLVKLAADFPGFNYVQCHYNFLRGFNEAKDCDIGVMVGSYIPPDAMEVAMALELIRKNLPKIKTLPLKGRLWTGEKYNKKRVYKKRFKVIDELAADFRQAEQHQGMARTRYLHHDVDFYVISMDSVGNYETFAEIMDDKFREDLFSLGYQQDTNYDDVVKAAKDWLKYHDELTLADIKDQFEASRQTISKHLNRAVDNGILLREHQGKKYRRPK